MWKNHNSFVLLAAAITAISFAANLQAEMVYEYDFNNLAIGDLAGQDNWTTISGGSSYQQVASGEADLDGNYVKGNSSSTGRSDRINDANWSFSIDPNMPFDISVQLRVGGASQQSQAGFQEDADAGGNWMLFDSRSKLNWYFAGITGWTNLNVDLGETVAKVYLAGVLISPDEPGKYLFEPYYQNLTDGGAKQFVDPDGYVVTATTFAPGAWDTLRVTTDEVGARVDHFRIVSQIPEPGSLALAGMGLIGLLCYAWRKRK